MVTVTLSWVDRTPPPTLEGYNVYQRVGTEAYGPPVELAKITTYQLTVPNDGLLRYFAVAPRDDAATLGPFSNEVVVTPIAVPLPPPPPPPPSPPPVESLTDQAGQVFALVGTGAPYGVLVNGMRPDSQSWGETMQLDAGLVKIKEYNKGIWWTWASGWRVTTAPAVIEPPPPLPLPPDPPPPDPPPPPPVPSVEARLAAVEATLAAIKLEVCTLKTASTLRTALRRAVGGCS